LKSFILFPKAFNTWFEISLYTWNNSLTLENIKMIY
jgi:hypothetical protein